MDDIAPPLAPLEVPHGEGNRDPHGDDGEWLSINAAARRLGVTATAIRNRIKRGTLQTRPNGNRGRLVRVPLTVTGTVTLTSGKPADETVSLTVLVRHVATLQAELQGLRGREAELAGLKAEERLLRARIEEVLAERDHWREQAMQALELTHQTVEQFAQRQQLEPVPTPRRRWWWWPRRSA